MSDNIAGFFDQANRTSAPSAKFAEVGDAVAGDVVDQYLIDYVPFGKKDPLLDDDSKPVKQLAIVLQTDLRDWEAVSKVPVDEDGNKKDPKLDKGLRAVYARPGTNIYSAIGKALGEAEAKNLAEGGRLGVQFYEEEDTGKGNPLKKFRAKYRKPAAGSDMFKDEAKAKTENESKGEAKSETTVKSVADDEQPF